MALLAVDDLTLTIGGRRILTGVSLDVEAGGVTALVGQSGSGKTMTALAIMRLHPADAVVAGRIALAGEDLLAASEAAMCARRGSALAMVFQEPMTALNPVATIGAQIAEAVRVHRAVGRAEAATMAAEALERVGLSAARAPAGRYPHELSGGQRQRALIAMATVLKPRLIIADEPVSALDVTSAAHILELLRRLTAEDGSGLLFISHDLAAVAAMADRLAVMHEGAIVESGDAPGIFRALRHPYSRALLAAARPAPRRRDPPAPRPAAPPLLDVNGIVRDYRLPRRLLTRPSFHRALDGVSLTVGRGESVGLVGESGSGKSTLARVVLALDQPQQGTVALGGSDFLASRGAKLKALRRHVQAVFQDPYGSFDPRYRVAKLIAEPLHLEEPPPSAAERRRRVDEVLVAVGLTAADGDKFPHQFSGGERQRLAIARALITRPALIVLDEPVSALDVLIRGQILDLLAGLRADYGLAYLLISHDLAVVRAVTDRVLVMAEGRIVEAGATEQVFRNPRHPYTAALVAATPDFERALARRGAAQADPAP